MSAATDDTGASDGPGREPRRRLSRAEAKARTREALLDSAASLFAERGYADASLEQITEAAGFTIGALYSNFANKQDLFLALLERQTDERIGQALDRLSSADLTDRETQRQLAELLTEASSAENDYGLLRAEFWLYLVRNPHLLPDGRGPLARPRSALAQLMSDDGAPGTAEEIADRATVVLALFQGLAQLRRLDPEAVSPELFGQALLWLRAGVAQVAREGAGGSPENR